MPRKRKSARVIALYAWLFLTVGLVHLDRGAGWARAQLQRLAVGLPLLALYVYFAMPPLVFPQAFAYLLIPLVPSAVFAAVQAARVTVRGRHIVSIRRPLLRNYGVAIAVLGVYALVLNALPVLDAGGLRDVAHARIANLPPPAVAARDLRVVPRESADFSGEKVVGQLGAYYHVGEYHAQLAQGRLQWVAPMEFAGPLQWLLRRTTPGVVIVSATDPEAPAELRVRAPLRYVPSGLLNEQLQRHVWLRYGNEQLLESSLQLDDAGNPMYVCALGRPTVGWSGQVLQAVVIVDPATGAMRRIPRSDFERLPSWVSRAYPANLAAAYNAWSGLYVHGLINAFFAKRDVHVPTQADVSGLTNASGNFFWFVDHTSPAGTDTSMTGFAAMDARTGDLVYDPSTSGEFDSIAAEASVASNPLVRQGRLAATQPVLYTIDGRSTWVVPLVAETGKYQSLALVAARTGRVVVGNAAAASPRDDALAQLAGNAMPAASDTLRSGTIDRLGTLGDRVVFTLRGGRATFSLASGDDARTALARPGDRVRFRSRTADRTGALGVADFHDEALP